jgi:hypothetical protein
MKSDDIPFYDIVGDASIATALSSTLNAEVNVDMTPEDVLNHPSINSLVVFVNEKISPSLNKLKAID